MASLLILTQPLHQIIQALPKVLEAASIHVRKRLYIHLDPNLRRTPESFNSFSYKSKLISTIYSMSSSICPTVDIRVLMGGFKQTSNSSIHTKQNLEKVLIDYVSSPADFSSLKKRYKGVFAPDGPHVLFTNDFHIGALDPEINCSVINNGEERVYDDVVAGGTFDRIHPGHKILLSEAVLRTLKRLTIGIADGDLLKRKKLKELILPLSQRMNSVEDFLTDIDHELEYNVVRINEPLGPTGWDPNMQMIVVSDETKKSVPLINNYRADKGLRKLESFCIKLFHDTAKQSKEEEDKFSSSSQRMRLLGTRIKDVEPNFNIPESPYVIGLTGGSASGKTNICRRLEEMGAGIVDCDKLGHTAYQVGTQCYLKLVDAFGREVLNEDGSVNRKILGSLVFNDKLKLKQLTDIVWPHIASLTYEEIRKFNEAGKKIVVLDAAVLLEAQWEKFCHEVWVSIIDRDEAIRRIIERDGVSNEAASKRIDSQMSNEERVQRANIVFCTFWSYEFTRQQVEKAWNVLQLEGKIPVG